MRAGVESLLRLIESRDDDEASYAISELGMLVEWSARGRGDMKLYRSMIRPSLKRRRLTESEQKEIIDRLVPLIGQKRHSHSLASIFSSVSPHVAIVPLLEIMASRWSEMDDATKHQCLVAIEYNMLYAQNGQPDRRLLKVFRHCNPRDKVAAAARSRNWMVKKIAKEVLPALDQYLRNRSLKADM